MQTQDLASVLLYAQEKKRVCPLPQKWSELWELLSQRRRVGAGWEPPLPLILAAWDHTTDSEIQDRLALHLKWAAQYNALDEVTQFLSSLSTEQWHYGLHDKAA